MTASDDNKLEAPGLTFVMVSADSYHKDFVPSPFMIDHDKDLNLVDLGAAYELLGLFTKDRNNLRDLRDGHARGTEGYERLNGKAGAVILGLSTVEISLRGMPKDSDEVFRAVIDFISNELVTKEGTTDFGSGPEYFAGYIDGLKLVLEKTERERQYI